MSASPVLIDTSVWIVALTKPPSSGAKDEVSRLLAENRVATFPMICLELLGGTKSPSEFNRPKNRLGAPHQMPADEATWETAVQLSYKFRHRGKIIPYTDILIASAAVINERTLLHADRHFDLMAQDTDLKVRSVGE